MFDSSISERVVESMYEPKKYYAYNMILLIVSK